MIPDPEKTRRLRFEIEDLIRRSIEKSGRMTPNESVDFAAKIMKELHDSGVLRA